MIEQREEANCYAKKQFLKPIFSLNTEMSPSSHQHVRSFDKQIDPPRLANHHQYSSEESQQREQDHHHHHHNQQQQQQQQLESCSLLQRKLFGFLAIYAILLFALYLTCYSYQHLRLHGQSISESLDSSESSSAGVSRLHLTSELISAGGGKPEVLIGGHAEQLHQDLEIRLESKIHLLERYIEVIAVDLQETKARLKEREKCDCPISCVFNSTRYADRSTWQNQCDTCTCLSGKISCSPQKCPQIACDDAITLPGQCCPVCMKKCKHNNQIIRHGQKFSPSSQEPNRQGQAARKECKCYDGLIKCEQPLRLSAQSQAQNSIRISPGGKSLSGRPANVSSGLISKVRSGGESIEESRIVANEMEPAQVEQRGEKQQSTSERQKTGQKWLPTGTIMQTAEQLNGDPEKRKRQENG